jgi:hypothetical protein
MVIAVWSSFTFRDAGFRRVTAASACFSRPAVPVAGAWAASIPHGTGAGGGLVVVGLAAVAGVHQWVPAWAGVDGGLV